jgi:hypothetical protein
MSGTLFLLDVIAFVLVAYWAYSNDRASAGSGDKGLLAMKDTGAIDTEARVPKWQESIRGRGAAAPASARLDTTKVRPPRWTRRMRDQNES